MNTGAINMVVHAHDARNAVPRLTCRYLNAAAGPGSWPGSSVHSLAAWHRATMIAQGRGRGQLIPALLGVSCMRACASPLLRRSVPATPTQP